MALGLVAPTSGYVEILGLDVRRDGARVLPRVGALVESPALYGYLSGRDNLRAIGDLLGGVPRARIGEVIEIVRLTGRERDRVKTSRAPARSLWSTRPERSASTALALGVLLLAGYVLVVGAVLAGLVTSWSGGLSPLQHISPGFWIDFRLRLLVQGSASA